MVDYPVVVGEVIGSNLSPNRVISKTLKVVPSATMSDASYNPLPCTVRQSKGCLQ